MKFTLLSVVAALAAVSQAAPGGKPFKAHITFIGAADASFSQDFPVDGSVVPISMFALHSISIVDRSHLGHILTPISTSQPPQHLPRRLQGRR